VEAHQSQVYCLAQQQHFLLSTSAKSLKVWDLNTFSCVQEMQPHSKLVKGLALCPEENLILTSSDRLIAIWDQRCLQQVGQLKGHKDEIKTLYMYNGLLYSAGKGTSSSGALFV